MRVNEPEIWRRKVVTAILNKGVHNLNVRDTLENALKWLSWMSDYYSKGDQEFGDRKISRQFVPRNLLYDKLHSQLENYII